MRIPFLLLFWLFVMAAITTAYGCGTVAPQRVGTETKLVTLSRTPTAATECASLTASPRSIACASWTPTTCRITLAPWHDNEIWGHELRHCFDGDWH